MANSDIKSRKKEILRQLRLDKKKAIEEELPMKLQLYQELVELLDQNFQVIRYKDNELTFTQNFLANKIHNLDEVLEWFEMRGGGDDYSILNIIDDELVETYGLFHYDAVRFQY